MIAVVYGTRPEAVKLGPVVAALRAHEVPVYVICTGQHTTLLRGSPAETDLAGGLSLALASDGNVTRWTTKAAHALEAKLQDFMPQFVMVQGDTMSALVGAQVGYAESIPVLHVEAGVRSHAAEPWPEEQTRIEIARLATWHYAPTTTAFSNLVAEGVTPSRIRVTGNTVVSAIARYSTVAPITRPDNYVVVTAHRREAQQRDAAFSIVKGIVEAALRFKQTKFVWPLHPAFADAAKDFLPEAQQLHNINLVDAISYEPFLRLLAAARGVVTDSGGVAEEAAVLGVPTVIARRANDRPEAVEAGIAARVDPTIQGIVDGVKSLLHDEMPRLPTTAFGGIEAADLVAQHCAQLVVPASVA